MKDNRDSLAIYRTKKIGDIVCHCCCEQSGKKQLTNLHWNDQQNKWLETSTRKKIPAEPIESHLYFGHGCVSTLCKHCIGQDIWLAKMLSHCFELVMRTFGISTERKLCIFPTNYSKKNNWSKDNKIKIHLWRVISFYQQKIVFHLHVFWWI